MKIITFISVIVMSLFSTLTFSQIKDSGHDSIRELLRKQNTLSVPYLSVQMLRMEYEDYVVLDTRKKTEYDVSHLPNAIWVGEKYDAKKMTQLSKVDKIVVYCTVGIRSEDYGEKLIKDGFVNVQNLYGSIFSWKDAGYAVYDINEEITEKVHVFGKIWSKYLKSGQKVY